jgi:hypothetical protein
MTPAPYCFCQSSFDLAGLFTSPVLAFVSPAFFSLAFVSSADGRNHATTTPAPGLRISDDSSRPFAA